ncbi:hypothetical protein B0T19DRAFT_442727 [Cercophora scortea]|uniref:Uncharacterized protein n=1 Tax=Cercophora scortea TaxID=314031 RepID=A0AAE0IDP9_9PEZI|nr:hypothetical protein B0T19DRAFT_442727 [Cercophora scortea]
MLRGNSTKLAGPSNAGNPPLSAPNSLGLTPLDSVQLAKNPFTVPIAADGSSTAIILAGPPLINHKPVQHGELLIGREFCKIPYLEEKVTLLKATLEQERLNLAALIRQNATAKLIGEVRRSIGRMEANLRNTGAKLVRKTIYRDEMLAQRHERGRVLPAPTPIIKQEPSSPPPVQTQNHWYDAHRQEFVPYYPAPQAAPYYPAPHAAPYYGWGAETAHSPSLYDIPEYPGPYDGQRKPWDGWEDLDRPAPEALEPCQLRYSESPEPRVKRARVRSPESLSIDRKNPERKVLGSITNKPRPTSPRREPLLPRPSNKSVAPAFTPRCEGANTNTTTNRQDPDSARRAEKRWRESSSDNEHSRDGREAKRCREASSDDECQSDLMFSRFDNPACFHQVRSALVGQPGIRSAAGVKDREIIEILD